MLEEEEFESHHYSTVAVSQDTRKLRSVLRNLIPHVRLPLIGATDLLRVVKPADVVPSHLYLKAMEYLAAPKEVDIGEAAFFRQRVGNGPVFTFEWEYTPGFKITDVMGPKRPQRTTVMRIGDDRWSGIFGDRSLIVTGKQQDIRFEIIVNRINSDRSGMVIGCTLL